MSLRPSERTEVRRNRYKVAVDTDDGRRRLEDNMIEIRNSKREESLQKKRREGMPSQNSILSLQSSVVEKKLETLPAMVAGVYTDDNNIQLEATTQFRKLLSIERSPPIEEVIQDGEVPRLVEFLMRSDFPQLQGMAETSVLSPEGPSASDDEIWDLEVPRAQNNKKRLRKDSDTGKKRGVCYLSRVPPHMDPTRLRQILSQYGDIHRIYLVPENPTVQVQRKQAGGGKQFSEGWVEFTRRSVAKKVANMLNGEQIGGKRRSSFYYDIWNIKYLNKFKWDDLTTETANNYRTREQKLTMEISAAKRERDFYLKKVDQSKALKFMKERMNKRTRGGELSGESEHVEEAKVIRRFPQNRPVADRAVQSKPGLSKDILKEVFGSSRLLEISIIS